MDRKALDLNILIRPNIAAMTAYNSARSLASHGRVYLDANESWDDTGLNRYPAPQPEALQLRLAELYDVPVDYLCMGRGSDEAIDLLVRATCRPQLDAILSCPPTYGMYDICAKLQDIRHIEVPMQRQGAIFNVDEEAIREALNTTPVKLVFMCRPNNPTGECADLDVISRLAQVCRPSTLLVVDEAYIEFAPCESATTLIAKFPNVVVLRTLSKAWAMAGARLGVAIATPPLTDILHKVRAPYPISTPVYHAALAALSPDGCERTRQRVRQTQGERERLRRQLQEMRSVLTVFPSVGNFLLVEVAHSDELFAHMKEQGIIVRDRSQQPLLQHCLRVSVGSPQENDCLLAAWQEWEQLHDA